MMRIAFRMQVHPGQEAEYIRRHNPIWPELEAALKNFYAGHQGCSDPERDDCQCRDCLAYRAYKVGNTPVLDAALAAAKREALADYLHEAKEFSERTFGKGRRTLGVTKHIEKEIAEVRAKPDDLTEWVDIIILACDGYWRHGGQPENLLADMLAKLAKNKARVWPTPTSEDEPVEHDRSHDDTLNPELGPEHREYWLRRMAREVKP